MEQKEAQEGNDQIQSMAELYSKAIVTTFDAANDDADFDFSVFDICQGSDNLLHRFVETSCYQRSAHPRDAYETRDGQPVVGPMENACLPCDAWYSLRNTSTLSVSTWTCCESGFLPQN